MLKTWERGRPRPLSQCCPRKLALKEAAETVRSQRRRPHRLEKVVGAKHLPHSGRKSGRVIGIAASEIVDIGGCGDVER